MGRIRWQDHIEIAEDLHHGDPCIRGTRVPVRTLIASLADGLSSQEILEAYPQLSEDNLLGALAYAADLLSREIFLPFSAPLRSSAHQG